MWKKYIITFGILFIFLITLIGTYLTTSGNVDIIPAFNGMENNHRRMRSKPDSMMKGHFPNNAKKKHHMFANHTRYNTTSNASSISINISSLYYYMYDLPLKYTWRWPKNTTECSDSGYLSHEHAELQGYGKPLIPENGLFLTWHFSLFNSIYNRLKRSKRRTYDPEKASLFIIPYDLGMDGFINADTCSTRRSCSANLVKGVETILKNSEHFIKYKGADHAVLWSLGHYHPWPRHCDTFMRRFCNRCTFTCYWMDPTIPNSNFISVPFPSGYHWWPGIRNVPWALNNGNSSNTRNYTAIYLGSIKTLNPAHTKIRRAMTTQCNASDHCTWLQIGHSSIDNSIGDYLSLYKKSIFCLCPPGDDPARKAVFDSILSGCIPVIFEVATFFNQYPWHIGETLARDIAVNIPGGQVRSGKMHFMSTLLSIPADVIRLKQEAIARLAPTLQYAMPPLHLLENNDDKSIWDPPFRDGVDVMLDGMFSRAAYSIRDLPCGIPKRVMKTSEWGKEYNEVVVQKPSIINNNST